MLPIDIIIIINIIVLNMARPLFRICCSFFETISLPNFPIFTIIIIAVVIITITVG